jgi:nitrogen fixation protein FixH
MTEPSGTAWSGRRVLVAFILFFGIVFSVNGIMVWFAIDSWPGLTSRQTYRDDALHSQAQAARSMDAALGWTVSIDAKPSGDGGYGVVVSVTGSDNAAPPDFRPHAVLRRPVSEKMDRALDLEPVGDGTWRGRIDPPAAGHWVIRVTAPTPSGGVWQRDVALWLK